MCVQCLGLCCIQFVPLALAVPATTYPAVAKQTVGLCCSIGSLAGLSPLMGPNALCAREHKKLCMAATRSGSARFWPVATALDAKGVALQSKVSDHLMEVEQEPLHCDWHGWV
jgi:hypothetical protein